MLNIGFLSNELVLNIAKTQCLNFSLRHTIIQSIMLMFFVSALTPSCFGRPHNWDL